MRQVLVGDLLRRELAVIDAPVVSVDKDNSLPVDLSLATVLSSSTYKVSNVSLAVHCCCRLCNVKERTCKRKYPVLGKKEKNGEEDRSEEQ